MTKVKFLVEGKEDSAGHMNDIVAIDSVVIQCAKNYSFVSVQLNRYKDTAAKLGGKSSSVDRVKPQDLYASDLGMSALDFQNMLLDVLAKKFNRNTVEVEAELITKSPEELKHEKAIEDAKTAKSGSKNRVSKDRISTEVPTNPDCSGNVDGSSTVKPSK